MLPVTPSRKNIADFRLMIADLKILDAGVFGQSPIGNRKSAMTLVAAEGVEPLSLDYRSSALPVELHREESPKSKVKCPKSVLGLLTLDIGRWTLDLKLVDPTGLKPAPYGLKGRRSVTRAPGQDIAKTLPIANCRLPICSLIMKVLSPGTSSFVQSTQIGNWQSAMIWLWRKDSNLRVAALTVRCLTNLATPQYPRQGDGETR